MLSESKPSRSGDGFPESLVGDLQVSDDEHSGRLFAQEDSFRVFLKLNIN